MSKYSISKSIILGYGWTNFEVLKMSNSYNLECANNNKELIPFCSINPNFGKKSNDELERCISLGARGIGEIHPTVQNLEMTNLEIWKDTMQLANLSRNANFMAQAAMNINERMPEYIIDLKDDEKH